MVLQNVVKNQNYVLILLQITSYVIVAIFEVSELSSPTSFQTLVIIWDCY